MSVQIRGNPKVNLRLNLWIAAQGVSLARNDKKETLVFKGFFAVKGNFQHLKVAFQSPLSVLWILRLTPQYDKSVFKSPLHEDGSAASDDIAVFAHNGGFVVVVVVVVKGVKDIFYARCYRSHTLVYAHSQAKVAYEIGFEFLTRYAVKFIVYWLVCLRLIRTQCFYRHDLVAIE